MQTVIRHRKPLSIFKEKLQSGNVTLGFLGGSITDAAPGHNWPEAVVAWLVDAYADVRVKVENAGIGATGSDLAVFRAKRDILDRGCDLVFVEYAVNDYFEPNSKRARSREGLIRRRLGPLGDSPLFELMLDRSAFNDLSRRGEAGIRFYRPWTRHGFRFRQNLIRIPLSRGRRGVAAERSRPAELVPRSGLVQIVSDRRRTAGRPSSLRGRSRSRKPGRLYGDSIRPGFYR